MGYPVMVGGARGVLLARWRGGVGAPGHAVIYSMGCK